MTGEPSELARQVLALGFERHDFPTMPWTIRNAPAEHLSQPIAAFLEAFDWLFESLQEVDYFEGNGGDLLEFAVNRAMTRTAEERDDGPSAPSPSE